MPTNGSQPAASCAFSRTVALLLWVACAIGCGGSEGGGSLSGAEVLRRFRAAAQSSAADVDVLGDGRVHLLRSAGGGTTGWVLRDAGQPLLSFRVNSGVTLITVFTQSKPTRNVELQPVGTGLLAVRETRFAATANEPDVRESWTEDAALPTVEVTREESPNHDGQWTNLGVVTRKLRDEALSIPATGSGCSAQEVASIQSALDPMVAAAIECLQGLDRSLALKVGLAVATFNYSVLCGGPPPTDTPTLAGEFQQASGGLGGGTIVLYDGAFGAEGPAQTLFHELLHDKALLGSHLHGNPNEDPGDRVYGCARTCFTKSPSSISCAACGLVRNGDGKCAPYRQVSCDLVTFCSCNNSFYTDLQRCTADCDGSLKCAFGSVCGPATGPQTDGVCP